MVLDNISKELQAGAAEKVKILVSQALEEGYAPEVILNESLLSGIGEVGLRFRSNKIYVPEVLMASHAMNIGMAVLRPYLIPENLPSFGRVVIGTVRGDYHDIGKNMVKLMMEARGLTVFDLGKDVPTEDFIETAVREDCRVIACSALLLTTMPEMARVVECARKAGIRDRVRIMIGGAPVTQAFCDWIGADAYTSDAVEAAERAFLFCQQPECPETTIHN